MIKEKNEPFVVGWLVGWLVEAKCVWVIRLLGGGLTLGPSRLLLTHALYFALIYKRRRSRVAGENTVV